MKGITLKLLLVGILWMFTCGANALEIIRYVKPGGTGKGTSWTDACGSINTALGAVSTGGSGKIYVGPGNYTETVYIPNQSKNISILGGYSENEMEKPDYKKNKVLLTEGKTDIFNASAVLSFGFNNTDIVVSGINIVKGSTGIEIRGENIRVEHCQVSGCRLGIHNSEFTSGNRVIIDCEVTGCGRGIDLSSVFIADCSIHDNEGLGMSLNNSTASHCKIYNNVNVDKNSRITRDGGGVKMDATLLFRCYIANNVCNGSGGGVYSSSGLNGSRILMCAIANNTGGEGGGIYSHGGTIIEACTVVNNKANDFGGGICLGKYGTGTTSITSSILWNNTAKGVAQQYGIQENRPIEITQSAIQGGGLLPETDKENGIIDISPKNVDSSQPCIALTNVVSFSGAATTVKQREEIFAQNFTPTGQSACIGQGISNAKMDLYGNPTPEDKGKLDIGAVQHKD